ncbi:class I adenylate-forming enzyme family protein [Cellulomonas endometrii]|uniref:class I adenylate-forming enzyme family protein n=1 Tax=Cellulomonas endometrii TaxID=3036301 RepID=UPI0024ACFA66|nr:AMP-binding protein [Cellulomonas endometrii]
MPAPDLSTAAALEQVALHAPETPSVQYGGATTCARDLVAQARALAGALAAGGTAPGDRVAHVGRNSPSLLLTVLACAYLRAIAVPLGFRASATELAATLDHCAPRVVVAEPAHVAAVRDWAARGPATAVLVQVDDDPLAGAPVAATAWRAWSDLLASGAARSGVGAPRSGVGAPRSGVGAPRSGVGAPRSGVGAHADDPALLLYTSGSSGSPKGVLLTHANLWWSAVGGDVAFGTGRGGTTLAVAPMSHIGGLNGLVLRTLGTGGTVVVRRAFDADAVLEDVPRHGVTSLFGVPAMYAAIARAPGFDHADLRSLQTALVGGAPLGRPLLDRFGARGVALQQSWGMTETAPACTSVPRDQVAEHGTTVGHPLAFVRLRLVDARGTEVVDPGVPGELWVSGPQVTPGYWRDPEATARAFGAPGWLRTGDVAVRDAAGRYRVCGRIGDVINTGGEKVHPAEVESALEGCPGVDACAVAGRPDDVWGQAVTAVVVATPGRAPTLERLRDHAARTLGRHKLPRHLVLVDALPRNANGKLDRARVRARVAAAGAPV